MNKINAISSSLLEQKFIYRIIVNLDKAISFVFRKVYSKLTQINDNKVLFITTRGSYNCNPRFICEELSKQYPNVDIVWVARKENLQRIEQFPTGIRLVNRESADFYREAFSAKILVDNAVNLGFLGINKKKGQTLIQTWHGSLGLKRFDTNADKKWLRIARRYARKTDFCISNSTFETNLYRTTFWKTAKVLEYGHPRNDFLIRHSELETQLMAKKIRKTLGVGEHEHLALYAPTFRDYKYDNKNLSIDFNSLIQCLENRFGGKWRLLLRVHFEASRSGISFTATENTIDVSLYPDIQDLLLITDVGITDYSSWICDYVLTRKPGFLFCPDYEGYSAERGFLYQLETTPFPIAKSFPYLLKNIAAFNHEEYVQKCNSFITDKGCIDNGHASEKTVEKIMEILGSSKK